MNDQSKSTLTRVKRQGDDGCKGENDQCMVGEDVCCDETEFQCYSNNNRQEIATNGEAGTCQSR